MKKLLLLIVVLALTAQARAQSANGILHGSAPNWANAKNYSGPADPNGNIGFRVYLGWNNAAAAESLARDVSDPRSSSYRKFLTPAQFRQQFAPAQSQVAAVQSWLRDQGFTLVYTPANNHYVSVKGSVGQAQNAFGANINVYNINGKAARAPATDVVIPASLADSISGVIGLDDSAQFLHTDRVADANAPAPEGFRNSPPLSAYWAQLPSTYSFPKGFTDLKLPSVPWAPAGLTPAQIKGAYGISASYDGAGQTIAIIDAYASPTILQDVNQWSVRRGLPTMSSSQLVQVVPPGIYNFPENPRQDPQGWYGEETLDVEAVHGMAPAAKIVYVGSPNNYQDLDAAMNHIVDNRLAQIVSNSYGFSTEFLPPGYIKPFEHTLIQAAIEGIGVYFSSGDSGDETSNFGYATTDYPASSPWVTAVGGTSLGVTNSNTRAVETGWGTRNYICNTSSVCTPGSWFYGAGGGVSKVFAEPSYQTSAGLSFTGRGVPDVGAVADPNTGFLVGQTQAFPDGTYYDEYKIGGTSLACPIFAGIMALADQAAGHPHGFANPALYAKANAFYDVLPVKTAVARRAYLNFVDASGGTNDRLRTFDDYYGSPTQHTNAGWDNVTGLGTPSGAFLGALSK